jgi:hypothetical protein
MRRWIWDKLQRLHIKFRRLRDKAPETCHGNSKHKIAKAKGSWTCWPRLTTHCSLPLPPAILRCPQRAPRKKASRRRHLPTTAISRTHTPKTAKARESMFVIVRAFSAALSFVPSSPRVPHIRLPTLPSVCPSAILHYVNVSRPLPMSFSDLFFFSAFLGGNPRVCRPKKPFRPSDR